MDIREIEKYNSKRERISLTVNRIFSKVWLKHFSLIFITTLFLFISYTNVSNAATVTVAGFNFEEASKRTEGFSSYTADLGVPVNVSPTAITPSSIGVQGASFTAFVQGSGGPGFNAPNADKWNSSSEPYWSIKFATTNYKDLKLSSKQYGSGTGPRDFKVQWSLNNSDWNDVSGPITVANNWTSGKLEDLSLPVGAGNQGTVYLRWITTSNMNVNGGTVGATGTNRIDDIIITGNLLTYTIGYNANGASSGTAPANQTKTHDVDINILGNTGTLARTGYAFAGWNTEADGSGTTYQGGITFPENGDTTLFAQWTKTYTI